jgi:hypothetical protein
MAEVAAQVPVRSSSAARISLGDHFWGATFSAGAHRPSFSLMTPSRESRARNPGHHTKSDWTSCNVKCSRMLIGNACGSISGANVLCLNPRMWFPRISRATSVTTFASYDASPENADRTIVNNAQNTHLKARTGLCRRCQSFRRAVVAI